MKRLLWLGVGLAIGALVVRAVSKKAQSYTPQGIAAAARDSGTNLLDSMRDFVDDVREGMQQRERELHTAFAEGFLLDDELDAEAGELAGEFGEVFDDPTRMSGHGPAGEHSVRNPPEGDSR